MQDRTSHDTWLAMTAMGRIVRPDATAFVVLFAVSKAASPMAGSIVMADGGYTCWQARRSCGGNQLVTAPTT